MTYNQQQVIQSSFKTMEKKLSKATANALTRQLFLTERAILLGRLAVLERELQRIIGLRDNLYGRVYLQWWDKYFRRKVIVRLLELNRYLGINVALHFTSI